MREERADVVNVPEVGEWVWYQDGEAQDHRADAC